MAADALAFARSGKALSGTFKIGPQGYGPREARTRYVDRSGRETALLQVKAIGANHFLFTVCVGRDVSRERKTGRVLLYGTVLTDLSILL